MFATKLIKADGTEEVIGRKLSLKEMQALVDGYIETIPCYHHEYMLIVNDEGRIANLPANAMADQLVNPNVTPQYGIRGNAILVTRSSVYADDEEY